jgi:hypothetical protein
MTQPISPAEILSNSKVSATCVARINELLQERLSTHGNKFGTAGRVDILHEELDQFSYRVEDVIRLYEGVGWTVTDNPSSRGGPYLCFEC